MADETIPVEEPTVEEVAVESPTTTKPIYVGSVAVSPITLENGLIEVVIDPELNVTLKLTADQFEAVKSDSSYPDQDISRRKWNKTIGGILALFVQDNVELNDTSFILEHAASRIASSFTALVAKKFGVDNKEHVTIKTIFSDLENS